MHASARQAARPSSAAQHSPAARPAARATGPTVAREPACACGGTCPRCAGGGQPLDPTTRQLMESHFDHDFSAVRLHTDGAAAHAAHERGAKAYTIGEDVVFGGSQFAPSTQDGRRLIAHELAHVVQQRRGGGAPGAEHEDDAEQAAHSVLHGTPATVLMSSARGVAQLTPDEELDKLLKLGPQVEALSLDQQKAAMARLKAGTASEADRVTLIRQTVADTRAFIEASKGLPLSYSTCSGACPAGRDVSATAFGSLASESPTLISVARYQSKEVFGVNKHGFTVITFADGAQYLVDPTFAQFLRPSKAAVPKGATAQPMRGDPNGLRLALELVQNGFVKLDANNARVYARALGVADADVGAASARLLAGKSATLVERVGQGQMTKFKLGSNAPDVLDRSEVNRFAKEHIATLKQQGDPRGLLPRLQLLANRTEPPLAPNTPLAKTVSGETGSKTTPPPSSPPPTVTAGVSGARATTTTTAGTSPTTAYQGAPLQPTVEATPGFNPRAGSALGSAIQVLQSKQFSGLQGDEVAKFLKKYEQLQSKIDRFFQQRYSVELVLIVEKPDRPDVLCASGAFCDSSQIIYFRDIFITRVAETGPPRIPRNTEQSGYYPAGGRDSFIPYTHQGGSIIEEHEIPHLKPIHPEHHIESMKETFYPPPAFSFSPLRSRPAPAPPPPKPKLDLATRQKLAAAPTEVYLVAPTIKHDRTADIVDKQIAGHRSFGQVKRTLGGLFAKRTVVVYWDFLDKPRAEELAQLVRGTVPSAIVQHGGGDGDGEPGHVQVNFGDDALRD